MSKKSIVISFFLILPYIIHAQAFTDAQIKAGYIYKFANFLEWPNEDQLKTFRIGICNNDTSILPILRTMQQTKQIKGKPIEILLCEKIDDYKGAELIYLNSDKNRMLEQLMTKVANQNTLVVSDHSKNQLAVMINFFTDENNSIKFEVNRKNIEDQNIKILPKLLLLGGTELDHKKLYEESEKNLKQEREKVIQQQQMLAEQQQRLDEQELLLENQKAEIEKQKRFIDSQRNQILEQKNEINSQKNKLRQLLKNIDTQEAILNEKLAVLDQQEARIKQQQTEVKNYNKILENQKKEIELQQKRIADQKNVLQQKVTQIETQQGILMIVGGFLGVILILVFFIIRSNKQKQKINNELHLKNEAISLQNVEIQQKKEEIESQRDELETQKNLLENKNHFINGSLRYAKTIQTAILPILPEMKEHFADLFVIFRPKDIVSGDFYWFAQRTNKQTQTKELFVAAVDCTGHGVPGAFMSLIGNRILNELVNEKQISSPAEILTRLDRQVRISLKQDKTDNNDGMDVCLCRIDDIDNQHKSVVFAGAKRPLFYYSKPEKKLNITKGQRRSIGGINRPTVDFTNHLLNLQKGDNLYLSTDGFVDQNNDVRKRFGSAKFTEILQLVATKNMFEQKQIMEHELEKFQANSDQRDDITLIGITL